MFGGTSFQSLFVGMGISITAIAVQSRILHDMHIHNTSIGHIIIGAAIVNDILALISLSILLELAEGGYNSVFSGCIHCLQGCGFLWFYHTYRTFCNSKIYQETG